MTLSAYKYTNGRLTPEGIEELHRLRVVEHKTYREIASALDVCHGTVYNVASGRTQKDLHPSRRKYAWAGAAA
jgi:hypothetical protein